MSLSSSPPPGAPELLWPRLVFVGVVDGALATEALAHEGRPLSPGDALVLARRRSKWNPRREVQRIIAGSNAERADVLLAGIGILAEHVRFYVDTRGGPTDARPLEGGSTWIDERPVDALEYNLIRGGEMVRMGPWVFRYEAAAP